MALDEEVKIYVQMSKLKPPLHLHEGSLMIARYGVVDGRVGRDAVVASRPVLQYERTRRVLRILSVLRVLAVCAVEPRLRVRAVVAWRLPHRRDVERQRL